jgi:hypothetical protein
VTIRTEWLAGFGTAPIPEGNDALVLSRIDTKYLLPAARLPGVLERLAADYDVALYKTIAVQAYESLYFDDARLSFYRDHQRGKLGRAKVRRRYYASSGFACIEVKVKTNRLTTRKWRLPLPADRASAGPLDGDARRFVAARLPGPASDLAPVLLVRYERLTLRSRAREERITFDAGLALSAPGGEAARPFPGAIVAEVKQVRDAAADSPFRRLMRAERTAPVDLSKYGYGIHLFHPEARHNLLKPRYAEIGRRMARWPADGERSRHV